MAFLRKEHIIIFEGKGSPISRNEKHKTKVVEMSQKTLIFSVINWFTFVVIFLASIWAVLLPSMLIH